MIIDDDFVKLTEDEAQLYDRQIRLWGLDAQKRLRSSRVLLYGVGGLGCEIAKNLVLAGIKSLTVMDDRMVDEASFSSNFLAERDSIGKNRAESCIGRLQQLNPSLSLNADKRDISKVIEDDSKFLSTNNFDLVVVTDKTKKEMVQVNRVCRERTIKFFGGSVLSFFGFAFIDLGHHHEFVEDLPSQPPLKSCDKTRNEPETKCVRKEVSYVSLEHALSVDLSTIKGLKRMNPAYFALLSIFDFQDKFNKLRPTANEVNELKKFIRDQERGDCSECIAPFICGEDEMSGVCAIVGGIISQEMIKVISKKDAPFKNFFIYNPFDSCGIVECIE